jgi:hypothetical protein
MVREILLILINASLNECITSLNACKMLQLKLYDDHTNPYYFSIKTASMVNEPEIMRLQIVRLQNVVNHFDIAPKWIFC